MNSFDFFIIKKISAKHDFPTRLKIGRSLSFNNFKIESFSNSGATMTKRELENIFLFFNFLISDKKFSAGQFFPIQLDVGAKIIIFFFLLIL